ncbi:acyltransferase [Muribaculaceae bacterium Z1]|nr:acyltransferase [Muribaculaceae bacterium S4]NBI21904.1 acyltransferase [Muribaculaceae bacterium Z1]
MRGRQYLYHFDVMKGIAIILVVMGHVMLFSFDINPSEPSKFIYFNMPLFFYISGYLAYKNFYTLHELGKRILQRGIVLLFPYLIFLCLYEIFSKGTDWNLSIIYCGGQRYWFLYDLFIISTFFLVYEYLIKRVRSNFAYVTLWILPYFFLIAAQTGAAKIGGADSQAVIAGFVNYYRYFLIGYLCKKYVRFNDLLFDNKLIGAFAFFAYILNWYFFEFHNIALIFLGTLGGIIVVQSFVKNYISAEGAVGKLLIYIGKCSLGIYVIHYFFIPDVSGVIGNFLDCGNPFIWQLTFAMIIAVPIVAASIFLYKLMEMNKWLYFIFFGKKIDK